MNAREEILARIQRSLAAVPRSSGDEHAAIARGYVQAGRLDEPACLELFEERLRDYGTEVFRTAPAQMPETVAQAMRSAGVQRLIVTEKVVPEWLPQSGAAFLRDDYLSYEDLDRSQGVLTTCSAAIALTGSIILCHPRDGRRAVTLIPDYHLCIVRASQVCQTVPEAIRAIESLARSPLTTVSGPSATSDIEMTRIKGVHGPRRLGVVLLAG